MSPRVDYVATTVMVELLDVIACKLEAGDDPDELARYIRKLMERLEAAAERPVQ